MTTKNEATLSLSEKISMIGAQAKLKGRLLAVWDHRYLTAGKDYEITDEYIYFADGYHIEEIGTLGQKAQKAVPLAPGGRLIAMGAVLEVETISVQSK
jgi:hypothetical protein